MVLSRRLVNTTLLTLFLAFAAHESLAIGVQSENRTNSVSSDHGTLFNCPLEAGPLLDMTRFSQALNKCLYVHPNDSSSYTELSNRYTSPQLNTGNTAWMLLATAAVMIMTPGLAFFYAGLAGEDFAVNTIMMCFVCTVLVSIQFFVVGYSLAFGSDSSSSWFAASLLLGQVTPVPTTSQVYGNGIPMVLFALFQSQFACMASAISSGSVVGRMKYGSFCLFVLAWTTLVYDPLAFWQWRVHQYEQDGIWFKKPSGWLRQMGSYDFAGGSVIHVASGTSALIAALMVGKRYNYVKTEQTRAHSIPLVMIGLSLIWFGWYGFCGGANGAANGIASIAALNAHLSGCLGFLTWLVLQWLLEKEVNPCGAAFGAVAGLVCITPGAGYVFPWASLVFGCCGSLAAYASVRVKNWLGYDDTLDAFAIHGCGGFVGGLLTGCFATQQVNPLVSNGAFYGNWSLLGYQLLELLFVMAYAASVTLVVLALLQVTVGLRICEETQASGLDHSYHGGEAYMISDPARTTARAKPPTQSFAAAFLGSLAPVTEEEEDDDWVAPHLVRGN